MHSIEVNRQENKLPYLEDLITLCLDKIGKGCVGTFLMVYHVLLKSFISLHKEAIVEIIESKV